MLTEYRKTCYIDCSCGISGDMMLGALIDAGLPISRLKRELRKLGLKGYSIKARKVTRGGLEATKVDIVAGAQPIRKWLDVRRIIAESSLKTGIKTDSLAIMKRIFEAEASVHAKNIRSVRLHELGAVDCLLDVVGSVTGLDFFGIEFISASKINTGGSLVKTEHGILPVPAPATAELLKGVPIYALDAKHELATPTGAAIVSTLCRDFGRLPEMELKLIGAGAGSLDPPGRSNILRILIGESPQIEIDDEVILVETNIDDMDPRVYEHLMDKLLEAGALDLFLTPIIMKKSRPAVRLSAICKLEVINSITAIILKETTTFGVRVYGAGRRILERKIVKVKTRYGVIRVKFGSLEGRIIKRTPEYLDCSKAATKHGVPLLTVIKAAERAAPEQALHKKKTHCRI